MRTMRGNALRALVMTAALAMLPGRASAEIVDGVAVVVNGDVITLSELEDRVGPALPDAGPRRVEMLRRAAEEAVDDKLVEKEAEAQGLVPTQAELDAAVEDVMRANNITRPQLEAALRQQGLTPERYREMLSGQLTRMKLFEYKVRNRVQVSEDEVKQRYREMTGDLKSTVEYRVRLVVLPASNPDAREELSRVKALVDRGTPLEEAAEDVAAPIDLGWQPATALAPEVAEQVAGLAPGSATGVLELGSSLVVAVLDERREAGGALPLSGEVRERIRQQLIGEKMERAAQEYVAELRRDADVQYRLP